MKRNWNDPTITVIASVQEAAEDLGGSVADGFKVKDSPSGP